MMALFSALARMTSVQMRSASCWVSALRKSRVANSPRESQWRSLPIVWSEGTLGVALAWLHLGQADLARQLVMGLRPLSENAALRCATLALPFQMAAVPCVAASAWLVLVVAALSHNPLAEQMWK